MVLTLFQLLLLMLRWMLMHQRLKKLPSPWLLTKRGARERPKRLLLLLLTLGTRSHLFQELPPAPKTVTASVASKPAATCPSSAAAATTTSKPAQLQNGLPLVPLASKPKPKAKSFAQAAKVNMSDPKFAPALSHENCFSLRRYFLIFLKLLLSLYTRQA